MNTLETLPKTLSQVEAEKGVIILKAVYKNAGPFTACPVKDPDRPGFYLGVERLSDEEKRKREYYVEPEKLAIKIKDGKIFDLSKIVDRLNWGWIKYVPEVVGSFEKAQKSSYEIRFYVKIEEVESQKTISRINLKLKALNLVDQDDPLNYSSRVRLLEMDMRGQTALSQKEFLMEEAEREPQKVINAYESDTIGIRLLVLNALDRNIIIYDQNIYSYNTVTLGMNEDAVVEFLVRSVNRPIRELIEGDIANSTGNPTIVKKAAVRPVVGQPQVKSAAPMTETVAEAVTAETQAVRPRGGYKK